MPERRPRTVFGALRAALLVLGACGGQADSEAAGPEWVSSVPGPCPEDLPICPPGVTPIDGCYCQPAPVCEKGAVRCIGAVSQLCAGHEWTSLEVCISAAMCVDSLPGGCVTPDGTPPACVSGEFVCPAIPDGGCVPCTNGRWRRPDDSAE